MRKRPPMKPEDLSFYTRPDIAAKAPDENSPNFGDWKALLGAVLKSADITPAKAAEFKFQGKGLSYIFAQALREQNPLFFEALTDVAIAHGKFEQQLLNKMDFADAARCTSLRRSRNPLFVTSFADLCDSEKYGMRGRVGDLMTRFKKAVLHSGDTLSGFEKSKIEIFIKNVEALSRPADNEQASPKAFEPAAA